MMMKMKAPFLLVLGALVIAALACDGPAVQPVATPPLPTAPPTLLTLPPSPAPPTAINEFGAIQVVNGSTAATVCYLYVSANKNPEWGSDRLGADTTVGPGESFTVSDLPVGIYDLRAEDCDSNLIDEEYGVPLTANGVTWSFTDTGAAEPGGGTGTLGLVNDSSAATVCHLYVSPSGSQEWGNDQFNPGTTVGPGQTFSLTDIRVGSYDLRATDCDDNVIDEEFDVQLTEQGVTWTFSDT